MPILAQSGGPRRAPQSLRYHRRVPGNLTDQAFAARADEAGAFVLDGETLAGLIDRLIHIHLGR